MSEPSRAFEEAYTAFKALVAAEYERQDFADRERAMRTIVDTARKLGVNEMLLGALVARWTQDWRNL